MLLEYGNTVCNYPWIINENIPAGYSRVYYVYGGEVIYRDEQRTAALKAGHLYIFPSAAAYWMRQNQENPLSCTYVHIDFFPSLITDMIEVPVDRFASLKHLLQTLALAIDERDTRLVHGLSDVFSMYCRNHGIILSPEHPLSEVLVYIAEHIDEEITIKALSGIAGYNEQYFIRLFKKSIGLTPYHYIISHRIKEAKKLLRNNVSITQASKMSGYRDIKSFSRAFRHSVGMSPREFRNTNIVQP